MSNYVLGGRDDDSFAIALHHGFSFPRRNFWRVVMMCWGCVPRLDMMRCVSYFMRPRERGLSLLVLIAIASVFIFITLWLNDFQALGRFSPSVKGLISNVDINTVNFLCHHLALK